MTLRPIHRKRFGAALVEFAVVLPVILLVFATMIEVSRLILLQHSVDTAAYEGARNAMVPGATSSEARSSAMALINSAGLKGAVVQVTPEDITEETPLVTVRVEVPVQSNAWVTPKWLASGNIASEVTLVCERPPVVQLTGIPEIKLKAANLKKVVSGL